jgi:predicted AlkP superfamily pyrophosphatase or phosphodiesterase
VTEWFHKLLDLLLPQAASGCRLAAMAGVRARHLAVGMSLVMAAGSGVAAPVVMISVDGMKPEYVLEAQKRGLKVPFLRRLAAEGTYAEGVIGVWPTVTYPSHTTLVTGVSPAEHGIYANLEFDPEHHFAESWFWYAAQIRVPTLWEVAHRAGKVTASIGWPATVGADSIDYLLPEFWRVTGAVETLNPSDRYLIGALARPPGLLAQMEGRVGPYMMGNDIGIHGDEIKTRYAVEILRAHKPSLLTLHLSSLDEAEHSFGPFSAEADQDLEAIDALLSQIDIAAHASNAATVLVVVSDHGFTSLTHRVNLYIPFVKAGLIQTTVDPDSKAPRINSWKAQLWGAGGMTAVVLHDPADHHTEQQVGDLLAALAADPANGIARIVPRDGIRPLGGFPDAAYLIVFKSGYYAASANPTGDLVTEIHGQHGGHGFSPDDPEMRASLFISGLGIARGRNLGVVDMRQIAPTLAQLMGVRLPSSNASPLRVGR